MTRRACLISALLLCVHARFVFCAAAVPAPGSVTVWDRIMLETSFIDLRRGYALMGAERYADAANEFLKAITRTPKEPYAHILYGSSLYWLGETDKAMDEFRAAAELAPDNAVAHQLMGIVHARKGEFNSALEKFLKASELSGSSADVKMNIGSIYNTLGDLGRALSYFREAVRLEPENPLYLFQLGLLHSRLGRYQEAKVFFKKAVSRYKRYEDAMLELAILEEKDGDLKEAENLYGKALDIKPGDNVARFRLACLLYRAGRYKDLKKLLDAAFLLTPSNDKGGISINLAYGGNSGDGRDPEISEAGGGAAGARSRQEPVPRPVNSLENAIKRIPADEDVSIQAEIISTPKTRILMPAGEKYQGLSAGLERNFRPARIAYLRREYALPASEFKNRAARAAQIAAEIDAALKTAGGENDARISLSIETKKSSVTGASGSENRDPKVVFKPRDVGNDMGLWVMGDNWMENVEEALDELSQAQPPGGADEIKRSGSAALLGFGRLIIGEPDAALESFRETGSGFGAVGELGSCAAWVEKGGEEQALAFCLEALKKEPLNKTALANKRWLTGGK